MERIVLRIQPVSTRVMELSYYSLCSLGLYMTSR